MFLPELFMWIKWVLKPLDNHKWLSVLGNSFMALGFVHCCTAPERWRRLSTWRLQVSEAAWRHQSCLAQRGRTVSKQRRFTVKRVYIHKTSQRHHGPSQVSSFRASCKYKDREVRMHLTAWKNNGFCCKVMRSFDVKCLSQSHYFLPSWLTSSMKQDFQHPSERDPETKEKKNRPVISCMSG